MEDVEKLNRRAFSKELDITKLSYHAYGYVWDDYIMLESGSALGRNCGPLLISKNEIQRNSAEISTLSIAIPGKYTTANLLFGLAYPNAIDKKEVLFSEVEDVVANGHADLGVIIHENRFTYQEKGLKKVMDLGLFWEEMVNEPIPLGGIAIKRLISDTIKQKINRIIKRSVKFAMDNPDASQNYVKSNAQVVKDDVIKKHIGLYVNDYTLMLGDKGVNAVNKLFEKAVELNILEPPNKTLVLNY
jgi:1,4-dihydroxy-6-naphthoate synthase